MVSRPKGTRTNYQQNLAACDALHESLVDVDLNGLADDFPVCNGGHR
jgi:hypothetical protein